jgi:hypothetical protein
MGSELPDEVSTELPDEVSRAIRVFGSNLESASSDANATNGERERAGGEHGSWTFG